MVGAHADGQLEAHGSSSSVQIRFGVAKRSCQRYYMWKIEKLRATPLPSMVVTSVLLELSDVEVKEGLVAGAKKSPSKGGCEGLSAPGSLPFVCAPTRSGEYPRGELKRIGETGELAWGATA